MSLIYRSESPASNHKDTITKFLTTLSSYQVIKEIIFNQPERTITQHSINMRESFKRLKGPGATLFRGLLLASLRWKILGKVERTETPILKVRSQKEKREIWWYSAQPGHRQQNCFLQLQVMKLRQRGGGCSVPFTN